MIEHILYNDSGMPHMCRVRPLQRVWVCIQTWALLAGILLAPGAHAADAVLRIGDSKGVYKALLNASGELKGLPYEVEWAEFPATAPALEALAAGAIDLRGSAAAPLIFALAGGAQIKAVAALHLEGPRENEAILVLPGSPIHTVADLRGKRIGTNKGSVGHHLVLAALARAGIPFDAVSIQYLLPADAKAALSGGSVDAWSTWDPYVSIAEVQDHLRPIVDGTGLPMTDGVMASSSASIAAKRAQLQDFLQRLSRAQAWARQHPESYAKLYSAQTGLSLEVSQLLVRHMNYDYAPIDAADMRGHQQVADLYLKAGVIRQAVDMRNAFDQSVFALAASH
jgi:sulfonate transport system substrate-binding protein